MASHSQCEQTSPLVIPDFVSLLEAGAVLCVRVRLCVCVCEGGSQVISHLDDETEGRRAPHCIAFCRAIEASRHPACEEQTRHLYDETDHCVCCVCVYVYCCVRAELFDDVQTYLLLSTLDDDTFNHQDR